MNDNHWSGGRLRQGAVQHGSALGGAGAIPELLDETHTSAWAPDYRTSVRSCLHTKLVEWEAHALRDLDAIDARG